MKEKSEKSVKKKKLQKHLKMIIDFYWIRFQHNWTENMLADNRQGIMSTTFVVHRKR